MELTCSMARDLEKLYKSGKASKDTVNAVEEHLDNCEECKAYFSFDVDEPITEDTPHIKVETSGAADELIEQNLKVLSKRLKTKKIISTVCLVVMGIISAAALLYDVINEYKKYKDK